MKQSTYNIPLLLTAGRMILAPAIVPLCIFWFWPLSINWVHIALGIFFVLISLTDFLDGLLARWLSQETLVGRFLDPLADKCLIIAALIALQAVGAVGFMWVIVLVLREIFVMGMRYIAREQGVTIAVSWRGRLKTWLQMIFITYVLMAPGLIDSPALYDIGFYVLLSLTVVISLYSAYRYYQAYIANVLSAHEF